MKQDEKSHWFLKMIIFLLFFIPIIGVIQIIRQDENLPKFSVSINEYAISMNLPKFDNIRFYQLDFSTSLATAYSGVITAFSGGFIGNSKDHSINFQWYTDTHLGEIKKRDLERFLKNMVTNHTAQARINKLDFEVDPINFWTSPIGHKVHCQDWSYKKANSFEYGVNAAWYCKQSKRVFILDILKLKSNSKLWMGDPLLRKYLHNIKCH